MGKQSKHKLNQLRKAERKALQPESIRPIGAEYGLDENGKVVKQAPPDPVMAEHGKKLIDPEKRRLFDSQVYMANRWDRKPEYTITGAEGPGQLEAEMTKAVNWSAPPPGHQNLQSKHGAILYDDDVKWVNENTNLKMVRDGVHEQADTREALLSLTEEGGSRIVAREARIDRTPRDFSAGAGKSVEGPKHVRRDQPEGQIRLPSMSDLEKANLITDIPSTVEKLMTQTFPELMQKFYPRIYEEVGRYHSPRQCAAFLANVTGEIATLGYDRAPTAYRLMLPALEPMAQRRMPLFFIAPDLLKAIQLTDFVEDIDWTTLRLPYEQGLFMLPKGALVHETDGDVAMILWARFRTMTPYPAPIAGWKPTTIGHDAFTILGLCIKTGIWYDSVFNADVRPSIRLHNLFYRNPGEHTPPGDKFTTLDSDLTETDEEFLEKLGVVAFGTFLAMNAKPELLEKGKLLKRVVKAKDDVKEFWSPNIIGPRYRLKREVPKIDKYGKFAADQPRRDLGGTHASPRLHWRRGHYRMQAVGAGRKEREQRWIEPCLVGADTEEEAKKAGA